MEENKCPSCSFINRPNNNYCTQCGHKLLKDEFKGPSFSVLTNDHSSIVFQLKKGHSTIGRDIENTIVINDDQISKFHATIIFEDDNVWLKDLESKNGVYVNGKKIHKRTMLHSGCLVKLGSTMFKFENNTP